MSASTHVESSVSAEAAKLHADSIVIDGCSFFSTGWHERFAKSGMTALQVGCGFPHDNARGVIKNLEEYYRLVHEDPQRLGIVLTTEDIRTFKKEGKVGYILGAQRPYMMEDDLGLVEVFHKLGVRFMQIAYSERSLFADGCFERTNAGLSNLGIALIGEMNRVGIQVDLSHVGRQSALEAIEVSEKPCIFSHSNPNWKNDHPRNITDEHIKTCAAKGGVIGLTPFAPINWTGGEAPPSLDDFIDHATYVADMVGIDHVSFGTDSEAAPGAYPKELHALHANSYPEIRAPFRKAHPNVQRTKDFETMEDLPKLTNRLLERDWSEQDIRKLLGENTMRAYKESWGA